MRAETVTVNNGTRTIHVIQGQYGLSSRPDEVLSTLLGSCVAVCLGDPVAGIGGMNHFLLPGGSEGGQDRSLKYGVHAMELLINSLLRGGARRERLQARVYGGANIIENLPQIGSANARFALWFLENERIRCVDHSLGGRQARRVRYWPHSGQAEVRLAGQVEPAVAARKAATTAGRPAPAVPAAGEITLF